MKVVHLWNSDGPSGGGVANAMLRLHYGLIEKGIDSKILCDKNTTGDPNVFLLHKWRKLDLISENIMHRLGLADIHRLSSLAIPKHPIFRQADIIHIHGLHSGFISYLILPKLTKIKPTVMTLHDMWAMTGHCAINYDCMKWQTGCGKCPYPQVIPKIKRDSSAFQWKLKKYIFGKSQLTLIAPCEYIAQRARKSPLTNKLPVERIHFGMDTNTYKPIDKTEIRKMIGIPKDKKVLMMASLDLNQHHKGADLLLQALEKLPDDIKQRCVIILLGFMGRAISDKLPIPAINVGYISEDRIKAIIYACADIFVHPTRADTLAQVILEALACGTPVVSFDIGGISALVKTNITGYLAEKENPDDLANGIKLLLENDELRNSVSQNARTMIVNEFPLEREIEEHIQIYENVLSNRKGAKQC